MRSTGSRPERFGRYTLHDEIAAGGMGTVHLGLLEGAHGFSRIVAIKRLHPAMASQPDVVKMFLDEARLAASVRHPNVVPTFDTIESDTGVLIVMEYVHGESLARLIRIAGETGEPIRPAIACAIVAGMLYGLHAAHEATDAKGTPLRIVHRDVSPSNVLVGTDGVARVVDFGVAKAAGRLHTTGNGSVKGKIAYMPPEQLQRQPVDRRSDLWAAGAVLWETLTGRRLFRADNEGAVVTSVLYGSIPPPSSYAPDVPRGFDAVTMRALAREPSDRYGDARAMCSALIEACAPAAPHEVAEWVLALACDRLDERARRITELETVVATTPIEDGRPKKPPAPRRRWRTLAAAGVLAAAGGALALARNRTSAPPATAAPAAAPSSALATDPVSPTPANVVLPSTASSPPAPPPKRPVTKRAPARQHTVARDCDPPYERDRDGHKIWKRECFAKR